jgi:tetratricopeptide (TPR) repeat protein
MRRNEPCFCGSGKRFKNCHGAFKEDLGAQAAARAGQPAGVGAEEKFDRATWLHEQGQLERARELYEAILSEVPDHFDALSALGVLHARRKNLHAAERLFRQALRIHADSEEANFNLAAVLCDLGHAEESLPLFSRVLAANPGSAGALNNRAVALLKLNRPSEALADLRKAEAITPDDPGLLNNIGNCLNELGDPTGALKFFDTVLGADEAHVGALVNKSDALNKLKRYAEAFDCAETALVIAPDTIEALNNRGNALRGLRRFDEALASYERALALNPEYVDGLNNRGHALQDLKRHEEALACFERAVALEPGHAGAHNNRGNALQELMRHEEALASYGQALALKPDHAEALFGRGNALRDLKRREDALASFEQALALKPDYADVHLNAGLCRLTAGDFEAGWREYEWRWQVEQLALPKPAFDQPAWDGGRVDGALLAWGEQGLGDQILHLGMLPDLAACARRLIVAVEPRLAPLVQRSFPEVEVAALPEVPGRKNFDRQVPLGSIGGYLRKRWEDFPRDRPSYLRADAVRSRRLREQLAAKKEFVCGLSWFSTNARVGTHKSIRLRELRDMLSLPGVRFVDLQYGDTGDERAALQRDTGIEVAHVETVDTLNDIDGVAALIDACDMVITVSNTNAHLAGALGKQVLVMLPYAQGRFWYWHEDCGDSPWYPSARLFRQAAAGDWGSVIDRVTRELKQQLSRS